MSAFLRQKLSGFKYFSNFWVKSTLLSPKIRQKIGDHSNIMLRKAAEIK